MLTTGKLRASMTDHESDRVRHFGNAAPPNFTRVVLFARKPMADMDRAERVRACYLHACLQYVNRQRMTNASLRERFGISENNASMASRLLNEAVTTGLIVIEDPAVGTRNRSYAPFWGGS